MRLTEHIQLKKSKELSNLCHLSKNLYNEANYIIRQRFFKDRHWTRYTELNKILKTSTNYKSLPIQSSQQIMRLLDKNWKSFFKAIKDWKIYPEKYFGSPKLPRYKKKNGEYLVIFTNQQCRIKDGFLKFPKKSNLTPIKTRIDNNLHQVRIIPRGERYILEIIYEQDVINLELDKSRIIGIDLGLNNLVTVVNNVGLQPFVIKGGIVKSINQYYNKQLAKFKSIKDKQKYKFETKRLQRLTLKRNNKIKNIFHKVSRMIISFCIENNFGKIIFGYNIGWKQNITIGKTNNQNFVHAPFSKLLQMVKYKAELIGIDVKLIEESHTSKCSFLDGESIEHHNHYLGMRVKRGLFKTKNGKIINADVNGAYNIIKKAVPNAFSVDGIEALGLVPQSILI